MRSFSNACAAGRAIVFTIAVCALPAAFAQNAALGSIAGVVRDASSALVPGATVTITNLGTHASRSVVTDSGGHYEINFLQPGHYEVVLGGGNFGKVDEKDIAVNVGETSTIDALLPAPTVTTDVNVSTDEPLLDTQKVEASQTVSAVLVSNLPLNDRRWDGFVLLTPNVAPDGNTGLISYRGVSGLYNTNLVDGANNQQAFFSEARGRSIGAPYVYPVEAIQEFQSSITGYSAELGQSAGGVVNAITKSGTDIFHGSGFWAYRTPGWNALDPYSKYQGRLTSNPFLLGQPIKVQNQAGVTLGGPIIKDKLFFHLTYDYYSKINPITYLSTYNTTTTSITNLVHLCDGGTTHVVASGVTYPTTITGVSPTQCAAAVNFVATKQLGQFQRNAKQNIYFPRLDYQLNNKTHLSANYLFEDFDQPNGYNTSTTVNNGGVSQNGTISFHERFLVANAETALNATSSNVVHFQFSRDLETATTNSGGPAISVSNAFAYGETSALPRGAFPDEHRVQITDIYSKQLGHHSLKAGADVNLIHEQIANLFGGDGSFAYSSGGVGSGIETNFANYIQDVFAVNGGRHYTTFSQTTDPITGVGADDFWNKNLDWFVEDEWKVTPTFLLSLGVRYDIQLVPQPDKPNLTSAPATAATTTIDINAHQFAPRIGFSWNPYPKTVVRGGAGTFYGLTSNSTYYTTRRENGVYQQQFSAAALTNPTTTYVAASANCVPVAPATVCFQQSGAYPTYAPLGGIPAFTPPGPAPINQVTGAPVTAVNPGLPASALNIRGESPNFTNPYTYSADLAVEQELPFRTTLTVAYAGTRGLRLPVAVDTNVDPTSAVTAPFYETANGVTTLINQTVYTKRLSTNTGYVLTEFSDVNTWYHSLVFSVRKPMSHGVELLANYTWARNMDDGQSPGGNGTFNGTDAPIIPFALGHKLGRGAEYSRSDLDQRGRFVGSIVAKSKLPIANRYAAFAVNGWQVSGTFTAQTGFPITAFFQNSITLTPNSGTKPSLLPSIIGGSDGGISGAMVTSGTGTRVPDAIARRNAFTGPGIHIADARLSREFPIYKEGMHLEFAAEAFNVLNHRNVTAVSTSGYSYVAPGGTVSSGVTCPIATLAAGCIVPYTATAFGSPTSTTSTLYGPRQLQLIGKFTF